MRRYTRRFDHTSDYQSDQRDIHSQFLQIVNDPRKTPLTPSPPSAVCVAATGVADLKPPQAPSLHPRPGLDESKALIAIHLASSSSFRREPRMKHWGTRASMCRATLPSTTVRFVAIQATGQGCQKLVEACQSEVASGCACRFCICVLWCHLRKGNAQTVLDAGRPF